MPHGGARPRSGPAPDPTALRRDRPEDKAGWTILHPRTEPAPEWPLVIPATPAEQVHWSRMWAMPQATQWAANGGEYEVAMYVRTLADAEVPGAPVGLRNQVRMMQDGLGISLNGMLRLRWKFADTPKSATDTTTAPAARPARGRRSSAKSRFSVVEGTGETA